MSTSHSRRAGGVLAAAMIAVVVIAGAAPSALAATAAGGRITRGDTMAAFQARTTGGFLNLLRGRTIAAAVRGLLDGRISSFADGRYCSADWHYLGVTTLAPGGQAAAATYLDQTSVRFAIDGTPVAPTMRA